MLKRNLILAAGTVLALAACNQSEESSVAAESNTQSIKGVAATGWALAEKSLLVTDAAGEQVASLQTGTEGQYSFQVENPEYPLILTVENGEQDLKSIVIPEGEACPEGGCVAHVNPITNELAQKVLEVVQSREKGLATMQREEMMQLGEEIVHRILGEKADLHAFLSDEFYRAAVEGRSDIEPSTADAILHTMQQKADDAGVDVDGWLDHSENMLQEKEFVEMMTQNAVELGVSEEEYRTEMEALTKGDSLSGAVIQESMPAEGEWQTYAPESGSDNTGNIDSSGTDAIEVPSEEVLMGEGAPTTFENTRDTTQLSPEKGI